ncbi:MAG: Holliday junction resolvase RuvX [bacterium]
MTELKGRILAIDFGLKRIGLAVSDPLGITAQGLPTIVYEKVPEALSKLKDIIVDYNIIRLVVGFPLNMKGESSAAAKKTKKFIDRLKDEISLPTIFWDERLTTVQAERIMKEMGKSSSRNKTKLDQISAVLILQSYLARAHLTT